MIDVEVRCFAGLRRFLPADSSDGRARLTLPEGANVDRALDALGVPRDWNVLIMVNGEHTDNQRRLGDGDVVSLFPPLAGGAR